MLLSELIGDSPEMVKVRGRVARLVGRSTGSGRLPPVLVQGETGTGKGLLARAIHQSGPRRNGPFVDVNCAAIPEGLLEAEMFGFERGAFTDARQAKPGLFQTASRGILFLDEIGLVPQALQSKLLKAIEERVVRRLGATRSDPADVWVVAATSEDLEAAIESGRFRRDLYHRLAVLTLRLPPLRERGADILLLAEHFLARACRDYNLPRKTLGEDARAALRGHPWPGNVRELANVVERVALLSDAPVLTAEALDLPPPTEPHGGEAAVPIDPSLRETLRSTERGRLLLALDETGWNVSHAAARLKVPRSTLLYRMERHGLRPAPPSRGRPTTATLAAVPTTPEAAPKPGTVERRRLALLQVELLDGAASAPEAGPALGVMAEKIEAFGGRVDQVHPRGVSGTFGLDAMEDAPRRAALCALAVHKAAQRSREETGHAPWSARAAIHVAEYHLDAGGLDAHVDRGGLEEAATTLTALLQGAEAGAVRVTRAAASFLERRFDLAALPEPAQGHRLTGRQHSGFGLSGRVTAFAGRLQELAVLESRLHSAVAGRGQVVAVIAEPGMGKSRLVAQFARGLDAHQAACFEGRCLSHASGIPFFPVAEIVRKVCGITDMDAAAVVVDKLRLVLETLGLAPSEQEPYLLQLLGVNVESARLRDVPPELMKVRTFEAVRQLALSANRQRALVLVLEDLHWIDKTSDEFLAGFVETIPGAPILLLLTYRPGYQAPWLARSYITQLALPALTIEESRLVLSSALDRAVVPAETVELLVARAEGNPFFLEELAQAVSEREDLGATVRVPDTIQGVLQARIDRLTRDDRRLLQTAAVIGRDVPFALLEAVAAEGPAVLRERLNRLQAAEFLHETRPSPHTMYFFKHALTQEVAYATLARQQQRDTHAQVARALRHVRPEVAEGRPEVVARHLTAADLFAEAAPHWLEAGRRAIARSANVEAVDHLQNAVQVLMQLPDVPARETRELELQLTLGPALIMTRGYAAPQVEAVYRRARELCDVIGDTPQLFTALWGISLFHTVRGDLRSARAMAERLLSVGVASADPDLLVEARLASGAARFHQGPLGEARAELEQAIALYDPDRHAAHGFVYGQDPLVAALGFLGRTLMLQGDEPAALACIERGLCRAEAIDHAFSRAFALLNAGQLHELRGDFASVLAYAERGIELATEYRFPFFLGAALSLRGQVLVAEGRHFEGLGLILKGVGTWRETGAGLSLASYLGLIGDTYRLIGDFEQGMAAVAEGLEAAERGAEHISEPELHRVRGELLAAQPARSHEAGAAFETALALSARLGAPLFARRAAASLEAYLRARGRQAEAGEILARFLR